MSLEDDIARALGLAQAGHEIFRRGKGLANDARKAYERAATKGAEAYEGSHWGREGGSVVLGTFPDPTTGATALGRLVAIEYETKKGTDRKSVIYRHVFGTTADDDDEPANLRLCPMLCYTFDEHPCGLVIARANSRYTVTDHGIEG